MDIEQKRKVREAVLKVFRSRNKSPGGGPAVLVSKIPRLGKSVVKTGTETFHKYKLYDKQNEVEMPLLDDHQEPKQRATNSQVPEEKDRTRRRDQETSREQRKRKEMSEHGHKHRAGQHRSSSTCHCSRAKEKRRKSRSVRDKRRNQQQAVNPQERSEFRKHIRQAQEITSKSKGDSSQAFSIITQGRLTRHVGLYNQGKKSSKIVRDPLTVSAEIEEKTNETLKKILESRRASSGRITSSPVHPHSGEPATPSSGKLVIDDSPLKQPVMSSHSHWTSEYSQPFTPERPRPLERLSRTVEFPKNPPLKEISLKIQNKLDLRSLFPDRDYRRNICETLLKAMRMNGESNLNGYAHVSSSSQSDKRSSCNITSTIKRNLEKDFQKYSDENKAIQRGHHNAIYDAEVQSRASSTQSHDRTASHTAAILSLDKTAMQDAVGPPRASSIQSHDRTASHTAVILSHDKTTMHDAGGHSSIQSHDQRASHTASHDNTKMLDAEHKRELNTIEQQNDWSHALRDTSHAVGDRSHDYAGTSPDRHDYCKSISYCDSRKGFTVRKAVNAETYKQREASSSMSYEDHFKILTRKKALTCMTDGLEFLRNAEELDKIWSASNSATESQDLWNLPLPDGASKLTCRDANSFSHSENRHAYEVSSQNIFEMDHQPSVSPSLPTSSFPDYSGTKMYVDKSTMLYEDKWTPDKGSIGSASYVKPDVNLFPNKKLKLSWHSNSDDSSPCWYPRMNLPHPKQIAPESPSPSFKMYRQRMY